MKTKKTISIFFTVAIAFSLLGCVTKKDIKIFIPRNEENVFYNYLQNYCDNNFILLIKNDETGIQTILSLINEIDFQISIIRENLANMNTLNYKNSGEPYKKKEIIINQDGKVDFSESTNFLMVYDPAHPESIKDGIYEGYVQFPSIIQDEEMETLKYLEQLAKLFSSALKNLDDTYIIPEYGDVWVPDDHKGTHALHWDVQHPDGSYDPIYPPQEGEK